MSEGKKIEIKIAATGGSQAAAEIKKVSDAAGDASNPANQKGFGGMLDGVPERAEEAVESLNEVAEAVKQVDAAAVPLSEHLGEAKENMADIGEESENASGKLDKIADIQRAQVAAELAKGLGMIGAKIREASEQFKEADPEFAATLENLAFGLESASSAANLAAQGFAVGGPFGAAIGALVGVALPSLKSALDDMTQSLAGLAASEAQAAEMARRYQEALNGGMEASLDAAEASEKLATFYDDETAAVDRLIGSMEQRNKLLDANNKADKAARDRSDATKIRNGADPETVKQQRVADDEAAALAKVDKDIADKRVGLREIKNAAIKAEGELGGLRVNGGATQEQIADAEKIVAELQKKIAAMEAAVAEAEALAGPKKREIRETAAGKGEALAAQRRDRKAAEAQAASDQQAAADKKAADEKARAERDAARQDAERLREQRRLQGESSGGRSSRGGRGPNDYPEDEPGEGGDGGKGGDPFRKLSAVEDGNRRAAARAKDREDRAAARQRDREQRGGREEGSLELRKDSASIPKADVDQFRNNVRGLATGTPGEKGGQSGEIAEVVSLMKELSGILADRPPPRKGESNSQLKSEIDVLRSQISKLRTGN